MGAQKNNLDESVLLSTAKHVFRLMDKKIIAILCLKNLLNWPYGRSVVHKNIQLDNLGLTLV